MSKMIDIDFIKKWVNITEEELMQRLVKDAIGLQKEAEQNQRDSLIKERKADTSYDLAFIQKFFRQYKYLSKYFSGDEILAACNRHMDKSDLTRTETIRRYVEEDTPYYTVLDHGTYTFKEYHGTWERDVRDTGTKVLVSNQYQNIYGASDVVRDLLLQKCPYLSAYDMKIYEIDERNDWIYIENPEKNPEKIAGYAGSSLYVPFSALMEKDAEKIVETHRNYWHEYGSGKYDEETDKFLSSSFVTDFLAKVSA